MQKPAAAFGLLLLSALRCASGQDLHAAQACTRLVDAAARLSCYDLAMGAKPNVPKNLSALVRQVTALPSGLYRLTLDNGQIWDTTQTDSALVFKSNDAVLISRGWLGSYQISLAGHTTSVAATRKQ